LFIQEINISWNTYTGTQDCKRPLRRLNSLLCCCRKPSSTQKDTWDIHCTATTHKRGNALQHTWIFTKNTDYWQLASSHF